MKRMLGLLLALLLLAVPFGASGEVTLPLTTEPVTLSLWLVANDTVSSLTDDYEKLPFFVEMEKRTGIHIDIEVVPTSSAAQAFNLMIASGELPDIIMQSDAYGITYADGLDAAVDDGYFLDLTPYLDNLAADYQKARTWDIETEMQSLTDFGRVAEFRMCFVYGYQPAWDGLVIRKDWLDELGLEIPVTYDDWHTVLTAFKEKKGATAALQIGSQGHLAEGMISGGYGVNDTFININKTIHYSPIEEGYREYLTMLNQWYSEGLIDPDFLSQVSIYTPNDSLVASGASGAWADIYTLLTTREGLAEGMELVPVASPVKNAGDTVYVGMSICGTGAGNYTVISADTKYPELAVQWCNYLFTEEGSLLADYGLEGDTYEMVDGKPMYTAKITDNPDGLSFSQAYSYYTLYPSIGRSYNWKRETQLLDERIMSCLDVWSSNFVKDRTEAYPLPAGVAMNAKEKARFAAIMADVETYVTESTTRFITGEMALDLWDEYVQTIRNSGIDEAISLYQAALDRYYAKLK